MPRYDVLHVTPLTEEQYTEVAQAITKIHTESFGVPSLFVNVAFTNTKSQVQFVAGKRTEKNHVIAHVRLGNRTREGLEKLADDVSAQWDRIVVEPHAAEGKAAVREWKLHSVLILASDGMVGTEAGMQVPAAGKEKEFLDSNWEQITRRADEGDELMIDTIKEMKARGMV